MVVNGDEDLKTLTREAITELRGVVDQTEKYKEVSLTETYARRINRERTLNQAKVYFQNAIGSLEALSK